MDKEISVDSATSERVAIGPGHPEYKLPLHHRVAFGTVKTSPRIFAAGPITLQPCSRPYRVVMMRRGRFGISVHNEVFKDDMHELDKDLAEACNESRPGTYFEHGEYFRPEEIGEAYAAFIARLQRHSGPITSVLRDTEPVTEPAE